MNQASPAGSRWTSTSTAVSSDHATRAETPEWTVRELALEVAPYKAESLRNWLEARSVTASITGIGTVTVPTPEPAGVMALVRGWMRYESVEALFGSYDGMELDVA
jgi:hypothetical protein